MQDGDPWPPWRGMSCVREEASSQHGARHSGAVLQPLTGKTGNLIKMSSSAVTNSTSRSKSGQWSPLTGTNLHLRRFVKRLSSCWRGRSLGAGGHAVGSVVRGSGGNQTSPGTPVRVRGRVTHTLSHSLRPGTCSGCAGTRSTLPSPGLGSDSPLFRIPCEVRWKRKEM